jgi:uncharacterized protein (TIGR02246 family)
MSDDEKAILEVFDEYSGSLNAGDVDRWMEIWDADGIQMPPEDPAFFGTEQIRERNGKYFDKYNWTMTIDTKEVRVCADWAYGRGFYTATLIPKQPGEQVFIDGKFLTILKRQEDGAWKFFRDCFNSNVPESA